MLNSNAMATQTSPVGGLRAAACVSTGYAASFNADDALNNDYFYDDEFSVPFDAHIACAGDARQLCRSLTDSCLDDDDDDDANGQQQRRRWRGGRLTSSRSESCLYRSAAADSQEVDETMMSTSERAGDYLVSSSELSDLDCSQRPLFSPLPSDAEAVSVAEPGAGGDDGGGLAASQLADSGASGEGGVRLRSAMYDAASAKHQYRLSFGGPSTPIRTSTSGEDSAARWTSMKTVGSSGGAGLTTWRQVSRIQPVEPGFTTWQRLQSSTCTGGGGHATARSVNLVQWSIHGHRHQHGVNQTPQAFSSDKTAPSGQLLRLYQSSRSASASPVCQTRKQTTPDCVVVDQHTAKVSNVAGRRAAERSTRTHDRAGRRTVAGRTSVDKCVQCLPLIRDRCVQTSTSVVLRADKSLQTSGLSDRVMHSALLLSRPLPDLDFLRLCTPGNAAPRRAEVVEAGEGRRHGDVAPVGVVDGGESLPRTVCPRSTSLGDSGHETSQAGTCRSTSAPRRHHGSDSGLSNNSSSSSGIEPGDLATSHDRAASVDVSQETSASASGPRKPPRSFTGEHLPSAAVSQRRHTDGDLPLYTVANSSPTAASPPPCCRLTCCCEESSPIRDEVAGENFKVGVGALRRWQTTNCNVVDEADHTDDSDTNQTVYVTDFVASHPLCRRSPPRSPSAGRRKAVEGLVSPTRPREAEVSSRTASSSSSLRTTRRRHSSTCHVHAHQPLHHHHHHHHHHHQTSPAKPAKSILVRRRQRSKVKHRSWSDEQEMDAAPSSECCPASEGPDDDDAPPSPQPTSRVARPVSLPDATVLYAGLTDFAAAEQTSSGLDSRHRTGDACAGGDDDDRDDTDAGEQFRAKKSVSFSEKIFYHSMPSISPLESPLCPPLKLPAAAAAAAAAAPECRFKVAAALQPASEIHRNGTFSRVC